MKKYVLILFLFATAIFAQPSWTNFDAWKLTGTVLSPSTASWTLSLPATTFTGTATIPTPFTLGAVSVTTTPQQFNYLNGATGTTGTTTSNLVFSTSPVLVTPTLGVASATSLALGGATIGTDALAVNGTSTFSNLAIFNTGYRTGAASDNSILIYDGDSITYGYAGVPSYTTLVSTTETFVSYNVAIVGNYASTRGVAAFTDIDPKYSYTAKRNVIMFLAGINDLRTGSTVATTYARIKGYCEKRKAVGWKVIVGTLLSQQNKDAARDSVNTLIRANWYSFADEIADFGADVNIGALGKYADATYFVDGTHPTVAGTVIMASLVSAAINRITTNQTTFSYNLATKSAAIVNANSSTLWIQNTGGNSGDVGYINFSNTALSNFPTGQIKVTRTVSGGNDMSFSFFNGVSLTTEFTMVGGTGALLINTLTDNTIDKLQVNGGILSGAITSTGLSTIDSLKTTRLKAISTGTAPIAGEAVLVSGTVTVNTTAVRANSVIVLTRKASGGTIGTAITYTIVSGTSFTINSDNVLDTSTFRWAIINPY